MITVKYLTFREVEAKLEESGNKFDFETALKNNYKYYIDTTHSVQVDNPIYQAGTIIDDIYVSGEHGYLVNHDFGASQNANPLEEDDVSSAACSNLKSEMENWLIGRARFYADRIEALANVKIDHTLVSTTNKGWDYNKITDEGTSGNTQKYLDTPETEADYSGDTHITNLTKNDGSSSNTHIADGKNEITGSVNTTGGNSAAWFDRIQPFIQALVEEFRKRWVTDAVCLGEGF